MKRLLKWLFMQHRWQVEIDRAWESVCLSFYNVMACDEGPMFRHLRAKYKRCRRHWKRLHEFGKQKGYA